MNFKRTKEYIKSGSVQKLFAHLYGADSKGLEEQTHRYMNLVDKLTQHFPQNEEQIFLFSTSGRTEIGGNHTDHNAGRVLAAAVNLDSIAAAMKVSENKVTIYSEGYEAPFTADLSCLQPIQEEEGTTTSLIRGIASRFKELGYEIGGFDAYITSNVLRGSGLSSSASIEVLLGTIFNTLYNKSRMNPEEIAMVGQYAENNFFGKPCGLMDQMACAVGGFTTIDFRDAQNPLVKKVNFDFAAQDYSLLVVDTGGNHADLTADYAAVPKEMKSVARALGGNVCRDICMEQVVENVSELREQVGDRALLRAMHFFADDQRVVKEVQALEENDFGRFLELVTQSGNSSWKWLQNCFTPQNPQEQGVTLALAITEHFINQKGEGACRVHGGGFAGTIQVFLPNHLIEEYTASMKEIFGKSAVTILSIRPYGTICIQNVVS